MKEQRKKKTRRKKKKLFNKNVECVAESRVLVVFFSQAFPCRQTLLRKNFQIVAWKFFKHNENNQSEESVATEANERSLLPALE